MTVFGDGLTTKQTLVLVPLRRERTIRVRLVVRTIEPTRRGLMSRVGIPPFPPRERGRSPELFS